MASRIGLETNLQQVDLSAGETANMPITVSNLGGVVDAFDMTVVDLDPSWYTLTPVQVSLFPQAAGTVVLQLHPPAQATVLAGIYPFQVVATSRDEPSEQTNILLQFTLAAAGDMTLAIEPERIVARRGTFNLVLTNAGNTERHIVLRPSDPDALLAFTFGGAKATAISRRLPGPDGLPADTPTSPDDPTVQMNVSTGRPVGELDPLPTTLDTEWTAPGGDSPQGSLGLTLPASTRVDIPLTVATVRRIWFGLEMPLAFEVAATPPGVEWEETEARRARGELDYRPILAAWSALPLVARRILALAIPLLILALLLFLLFRPKDNNNPTAGNVDASATQTALAAGAAQTQTALALANVNATQTALAKAGIAGPLQIVNFDFVNGADGGLNVSWQVTNALTVTLNMTPVPLVGTQVVKADSDQALNLQATNGKDTISQAKGILLMRPPEIKSFVAEPAQSCPGCPVILRWSTGRAEKVRLDGKTVAGPDGTVTVNPNATTEYVLSADSALGNVEMVLTVNVAAGVPSPTPVSP